MREEDGNTLNHPIRIGLVSTVAEELLRFIENSRGRVIKKKCKSSRMPKQRPI
jgi:hypothetical protein